MKKESTRVPNRRGELPPINKKANNERKEYHQELRKSGYTPVK